MSYSTGGTIHWIGSPRPDLKRTEWDEHVLTIWDKVTYSIKTGKPMIITGGIGFGKSSIMGEIDFWLNHRTRRESRRYPWLEVPNWWVEARDYCTDVRRGWNYARQFSDWNDVFSAEGIAGSCKRLFLDDLGDEPQGGENMPNPEILAELFRQRYVRGLPTWITTNLSVPQIIERYGQRIMSRMIEKVDVIALSGVDRRMKAFQDRLKAAQ